MWTSPLSEQKGCGAVFTHVSSQYYGTEDRIKAMRPDLEYVA